MPWWRRLLCIIIGAPIALSGAFLMMQGVPRVLIIGAFLLGVGGLLALSGISPARHAITEQPDLAGMYCRTIGAIAPLTGRDNGGGPPAVGVPLP